MPSDRSTFGPTKKVALDSSLAILIGGTAGFAGAVAYLVLLRDLGRRGAALAAVGAATAVTASFLLMLYLAMLRPFGLWAAVGFIALFSGAVAYLVFLRDLGRRPAALAAVGAAIVVTVSSLFVLYLAVVAFIAASGIYLLLRTRPPAVWSVPVMVLLVFVAWWFNDGTRYNDDFYELWVNGDPQGDAQQYEWIYSGRIFRYTSGVLCGQFLALLAGAALARRYPQAAALARAAPLAVILAGVTFAVAYPLARAREAGFHFTGVMAPLNRPPLDDPVLVRVLACELVAYPLYAVAGVGIGTLLGHRRRLPTVLRWLLGILILVAWWVATMTGLLQDDRFAGPYWLLWTIPPVAAGAAIALAGGAIDVDAYTLHGTLTWVGDSGRGASIALLVSAAAYALALNLLGGLAARRRRRLDAATETSGPAREPDP